MTMHEGHRGRMRERFRKEGLDGFAAHQVLELLLFYGRSRGDTNPLAHRLLEAFGSLQGVLEAKPEQLMQVNGVGEETATLLSLMLPLFRRYEGSVCANTQKLTHYTDVRDYCYAMLVGYRKECFGVISVSSTMKVLGSRIVAEGVLTEVPAYPRLVVEAALNHNAYGVILCHNHPGGEARPSQRDIDMTHLIQDTLRPLGIGLLDHMIVADGLVYSMAHTGDICASFGPIDGFPYGRLDQAWPDEWI